MLRSFDADGQHFAFHAVESGPDTGKSIVEVEHGPQGATATIDDAHLLFNAEFKRAGSDLVLTGDDGKNAIVHHYFDSDNRVTLRSAEGASLSPDVVDALAGSLAPGQYAQATPAQANAEAVGRVATVSGNATIMRNGVAVTVSVGDAVLKGDVLQTGSGAMGVTFNDSSTLNLTANSRLVVNEFVYDPNGTANSQLISLVQGSLTMISGQVAHTGTMKVDTPVATMGIRGTFFGVTDASDGAVQVWVNQSSLGIEAVDHNGAVLGTITQDGPMLVFHPSSLQVLVQELQRGPQQIATELSALQAIIATQSVGQRLIDQYFNPNNPNPQSTDHPHSQFDLLILPNNTQNASTTGAGDSTLGSGVADGIKVQVTTQTVVGTTVTEEPVQTVFVPLTNFPPVVSSPPPQQETPSSNDAPIIFTEQNNNAVTVSDPDTPVLSVTLTASHGTVALGQARSGLVFAPGDTGNADDVMTFTGTQQDINTALDGLVFTPTPTPGNHQATLQITATDGTNTTTQTINFTTDAQPVVNPGSAASYAEHNSGVPIVGSGFQISDADDPQGPLQTATVTLTNRQAGDLLSVSGTLPGNIQANVTADNDKIVVTLTGAASLADYQAALHQITFSSGDNPDTTDRDITITVNDGIFDSDPAHATIHVAQVNDPPVIVDPTEDTNQTAEDTQLHLVANPAIIVSDSDAGSDPLKVTLHVEHGTLTLPTIPADLQALVTSVQGDGTDTITLLASQDTVNRLIHEVGVNYQPDHDFNGNADFTFTVDDQGHNGGGGAQDASITVHIAVTPVNDAPVVINGENVTLSAINEDAANPGGFTLADLLTSHFSDAADEVAGGSHANALAGFAIYANPANSAGAWQWSSNGSSWNNIPSNLTDSSALVLAASALIRFVPSPNYNGPVPQLIGRLIDDSAGPVTSNTTVDLTTATGNGVGGTTPYSAAPITIGETVNSVNDAPVIEHPPIVTEIPIPNPLPPGTDALAVHEVAPSMSEDGRWVVFFSTEQIPEQGNNNNDNPSGDVFLYDRLTGVTKVLTDDAHIPLASRPQDGTPEHYSGFSISGDGSTVVFRGEHTVPQPGFPDQQEQVSHIYVYDRPTDTVHLLTNPDNGNSPFTVNDEPRIAGGHIVFASNDFGDFSTPPTRHIYVTDLAGHIQTDIQPGTIGITEPTDGNDPNFNTQTELQQPDISGNGRYLTFWTVAHTYDSNTNTSTPAGPATLYTFDRANGQYQTIATSSDDNWWASMSNDGQHVVFQSDSDALDTQAGGVANGHMDIFVWDRATNTITGVTENATVHSDGASLRASISANGSEIIFASDATNLVPGDANGQGDTFVYDRPSNTITLVSVASDGTQGDGDSTLGADVPQGGSFQGAFIAFGSTAGNLVTPNDTDGGQSDVFVVDRPGGIFGAVMEDDTTPAFVGAPAGSLSTYGAFNFSDVDLTDTHTVQVIGNPVISNAPPGFVVPPGGFGTFTPTLVDTGGTGHGQLQWTFVVDNALVQGLNGGQQVNQVYTVQIDDGHGGVAQQDVTIVIEGKSDAPVIDAHGGSLSYTENGPAAAIDAALTVSDVDSANLTGAKVSITGNFHAGQDVLGFANQSGIAGNYNSSTGVLTLTGIASLAAYQTALRSVTYSNSSDNPSADARTISYQVNDESSASNVATATVSVTAVNNPPAVAANGGSLSYSENGAAAAIDTALTVSDVDSANLVGATVSIANFHAGEDVLGFTAPSGITGVYNAGVLTLSGTASVATYQDVLRSVTYSNTSDNPSADARTINYQVNDGSALSNVATATVSVTPVNDAPVLAANGGSASYPENAAPVPIDTALTVSDVDSANLASAKVSITGNFHSGQDVLNFTNQNGITGTYDSSTGVLALIGAATLAQYQDALRSVTYSNSSDNPSADTRTISFQVDDGSSANHTSNVATATVSVTPVNDAPAVAANGGSASYTENAAPAAIDAALTVSDVDSSNLAGATVSITGNFHSGEDTLGFTDQNGIHGAYNNGVLTLSGSASVADYQAALRSVTYSDSSDDPSSQARTISFQVNDGSSSSNAATATVSVIPVNDVPVITGVNSTGGVPTAALSLAAASYLTHDSALVNGLGGNAGFGEQLLDRNDDGSTGAITIGGTDLSVFGTDGLNFFGHTYTSLYINNNGNITFAGAQSSFTPSEITAGFGNPIIAPFWADVDTRGGSGNSDLVYYDLDNANHVLTVTWYDVGYYSQHTDKVDAFQLQLIGLGDGNFDIVFRYDDITWTTGDASGGSGGLGGTPARIGYSAGDGNPSHYFELSPLSGTNSVVDVDTDAGNQPNNPGVYLFQVLNGNVAPAPVANGTIDFTDPEAGDTHTASVSHSGAYVGSLVVENPTEPTSSTQGSVAWHFDLSSTDLNGLSPGQTKTESYQVTVSDGHPGGQTTQTMAFSWGSVAADTFSFAPQVGADTVLNFQLGTDALDFNNGANSAHLGPNMSSADASHILDILTQNTTHDAVLNLGNGDTVTLAGVSFTNLQTDLHNHVATV